MRSVYLVPGNSEGSQEWIWLPADLISPSFSNSLLHLQVLHAMSATVCSFSLLYGLPWATYNYPKSVRIWKGLQRDSLSLIVLAYCHSWGLSSLSMACAHTPHSYLCWSFPLKPKHTPKYTLPHRSASGEHNVRQQTSLRTNIYKKLTFSRPTLAIANILSHWLPPKRYISTILTLETLKLQKRKTSSCT